MDKHLTKELTVLTAFFTNSLDMLCIVGPDGKFARVNPAWQNTLGYTIEGLVKRPFADFIHPDDLLATMGKFGELMGRGQNLIAFENRYRCKNGTYKRIQWTATPNRGENNEILEVHATGRDVTEHKRAEEDLNRFFEKSLEMLCIVGPDGTFARVNPAWKEKLGFTTEEVAGKHFKDFIQPENIPATMQAFDTLLQGQNLVSFENRYRCRNGTYKRIH